MRSHVDNVQAEVADFIERHRLLGGIGRLGLAVSAGADSVALLHLLLPLCRRAGIETVLLHLNHRLRGAGALADARFVQRLSTETGTPCCLATAAAPPARAGASMEMAARELRLAFYASCARRGRLDAVATGHHADDVAETLLLRLARGAGAAGLSGLRPRALHRAGAAAPSLTLIRPLLGQRREALRDWLNSRFLEWREDPTNADTRIRRNRLRCEVMPFLERVWDRDIQTHLAQSAEILREEDACLERIASEAGAMAMQLDGSVETAALIGLPPAVRRRVLRAWLLSRANAGAAGYNEVLEVERRLTMSSPWQFALPKDLLLCCRHGRLRLRPARPAAVHDAVTLAVPGRACFGVVRASAELAVGIAAESGPVGRLPAACSLDLQALAGRPLIIRRRRPGDRLRPTGMKGSRKLQDILVDAKIPPDRRDDLPVLACGDEVVWIPGYRVAEAFAVRDAARPAVQVRLSAGSCAGR